MGRLRSGQAKSRILASGRPVLAWANGEVAQVVKGAGCGFIADPGNIEQLEGALRPDWPRRRESIARIVEAASRCYSDRFWLRSGVDTVEGILQEMVEAK